MDDGHTSEGTLLVETPEGIELELRPAGIVARGLAWLLDVMIRAGVYLVLSISLGLLGQGGAAVLLVVLFALEWFYPVVGEVWFNGVTPGKRAVGVRVVRDDGAPVGLQASLVRNLLRAIDFLPLFNAFGVTSMVCSQRFQRLGDLAAGTLVVYDAKPRAPSALSGVAPLPPPVPLTLREQQLLLDFADRRESLSEARREELATSAGDLLGDGHMKSSAATEGEGPATRRMLAYAAWLAGDTGAGTLGRS